MTARQTNGVHHLGLTTSDLAATHAFFTGALGFEEVGAIPEYPAVFVTDGTTMITLWQVQDKDSFVAFDRHNNTGLHHVAFGVSDTAQLIALHDKIAAWPEVEIECAPGPMGKGAQTSHFLFMAPGGIRVELATPFG